MIAAIFTILYKGISFINIVTIIIAKKQISPLGSSLSPMSGIFVATKEKIAAIAE